MSATVSIEDEREDSGRQVGVLASDVEAARNTPIVDGPVDNEVDDAVENEENPPQATPPNVADPHEPSLEGDYLPVASPVPPPTNRRISRPRQRQEEDQDIPHAIPHDLEEEAKRHRRHRLWIVSLVFLAMLILVGIILGVTLGRSSNSNGTAGPTGPTPSPTTLVSPELQQLIESISFDGGATLEISDSPQSKALAWLGGNANLDDYPDWKRIQRYVLAVLYYSTSGDDWREKEGWLSDEEECAWLTHDSDLDRVCNENGAYNSLWFEKNNLEGMFPLELALLSASLCKFVIYVSPVVLAVYAANSLFIVQQL